jgi:hypothetical protein
VLQFIIVADIDLQALQIAVAYWRVGINGALPDSPLRVESFDALVEQGPAVAGSPVTVANWLSVQITDSKANCLVGQFCFGDLSLHEMLQSVESLATEVIPKLRDAMVGQIAT